MLVSKKADMTSVSHCATSSLFGVLVLLGVLGENASAGDYGSPANPCAAYGPDYAAVSGSGTCVRIGGHVRVQLGTNAGLNPNNGWSAGTTSSAALRSDATAPTHLRVRGGLEYPDPFR